MGLNMKITRKIKNKIKGYCALIKLKKYRKLGYLPKGSVKLYRALAKAGLDLKPEK